MATLSDIAGLRTSLEEPAIGHLHRLVAAWSLLADLAFSDMFLVAPAAGGGSASRPDYVVLAQVRPNNRATMLTDDLVGTTQRASQWPLIERAFETASLQSGTVRIDGEESELPHAAIPVGFNGSVVAVLVRVQGPLRGPASAYESAYLGLFERFCRMISEGTFPFRESDVAGEGFPRVGDGIIQIDQRGIVDFATPNAVNALHRLGLYASAEGRSLKEMGLHVRELERAREYGMPRREDVTRGDVVIDFLCIPLLEADVVTGVVVVLRDVSELKRFDRELTSKDAAIREVHHRVKNNLQTISSMLRLQARRSNESSVRTALLEAERRIRSIAVVHEVLSREPGEIVEFSEIIPSLVTMVEESEFGAHEVEIYVDGDLGALRTDLATPLAIVVAELLMNCAEHAFTELGAGDLGMISVTLRSSHGNAVVEIADNGVGFGANFSIDVPTSLGLAIVRDLVRNQLRGTIVMTNRPADQGGGAVVTVKVPLVTA